jgi:hypothetical protein
LFCDSGGSTPIIIDLFCYGGGGNYSGCTALAGVITTVAVDPVFIITLLTIGALYVTVSTHWCFTVAGTVVFVRVVSVITLLARVDNAITTNGGGDYLAALGFKGAISVTGGITA